jgi:hypothetical protein
MAAKIHPSDWDVLFAPNAPRRGGPLRVLANVLIIGVILTVALLGTLFAISQRNAQVAAAIVNATRFAATNQPLQTATAEAAVGATATRIAARTATAVAQPTSPAVLGIGAVNSGGNLRSEPRVAPETVTGLVWPGDQVVFLEQRDVGGLLWYRIRITGVAPNRAGDGVPVNTEGWAAASLLSPIAQPQP